MDALALGRQALVATITAHHGEAEILLESANPGGEGRLRDTARAGGAGEVPLPFERDEVVEVLRVDRKNLLEIRCSLFDAIDWRRDPVTTGHRLEERG